MKLRATPLLFVLSTVILTGAKGGCTGEDSANVDQDRIYSSYWLEYDANQDRTIIHASLRLGHELGTALEALPPAELAFEGERLTFDTSVGWHTQRRGGMIDGGTFTWTNAEGRVFENEVGPLPRVDFPAGPLSLSRDRSYELNFVGEPLQEGEELEVYLTGPSKVSLNRVSTKEVGATRIVLPADQIAQLTPGSGFLAMRRFRNLPGDGTEVGSKVTGSYQPRSLPITVE